jgi:hypothetical protein
VLFPVLAFLGAVTFQRVSQSSIKDTLYLQRINRIRRFYHEAAPDLTGYLGVTAPTDDVTAVLALDGYSRSRWQFVLSAVGMAGVINSVLIGAVASFAMAAIVEDSLWADVLAGAVVFAVAVVLHQRYQLHARYRKPFPFADGAAVPTSETAELNTRPCRRLARTRARSGPWSARAPGRA